MGSHGPIIEEPGQITVGPSSMIKFTKWKDTAYDVWAFVHSIEVEENIPIEQWPCLGWLQIDNVKDKLKTERTCP